MVSANLFRKKMNEIWIYSEVCLVERFNIFGVNKYENQNVPKIFSFDGISVQDLLLNVLSIVRK